MNYLKHKVVAKNSLVLKELIGYLEKHHSEIIDYDRRRRVGKCVGSGRMEKGVDLVVGHRQKKKGLSWSSNGSKALSLLKIAELNRPVGKQHKIETVAKAKIRACLRSFLE